MNTEQRHNSYDSYNHYARKQAIETTQTKHGCQLAFEHSTTNFKTFKGTSIIIFKILDRSSLKVVADIPNLEKKQKNLTSIVRLI